MGVKRKNEKKYYREWLTKYAVKIKCCYCDAYNTCRHRTDKEKLERQGVTTRCVDTPNRRQKSGVNSEIPTFKQYLRNRSYYNPSMKEGDIYDRLTRHQGTSPNTTGANKRVPYKRKSQRH